MKGLLVEGSYIVFIAIYSLLLTHYIPKKYYSFGNLLIGLGSIAYGLLMGLSLSNMGLQLQEVPKGLAVGVAISLPIVIVLICILRIPRLHHLFMNGPSKRLSPRAVLYDLGFRVPFGTALSEEIIFRGVLLGLALQYHTQPVALITTALLFGLWHILPTLQTIRTNDAFDATMRNYQHRHILSVVMSVIATTVAGLGLGWLRLRASSLVAPWIVHATINGFSIAGGYLLIWRTNHAKVPGKSKHVLRH